MENFYTVPEIDIIKISNVDIITYSPLVDGAEGDGGWVDFDNIVNG